MGSELVKPHHLQRRAVIYVRQSTPHQVLTNQESLRLQYALQHRAREFGWHEAEIDVIDSDLGMSGAAVDHRQGFKELVRSGNARRNRHHPVNRGHVVSCTALWSVSLSS